MLSTLPHFYPCALLLSLRFVLLARLPGQSDSAGGPATSWRGSKTSRSRSAEWLGGSFCWGGALGTDTRAQDKCSFAFYICGKYVFFEILEFHILRCTPQEVHKWRRAVILVAKFGKSKHVKTRINAGYITFKAPGPVDAISCNCD